MPSTTSPMPKRSTVIVASTTSAYDFSYGDARTARPTLAGVSLGGSPFSANV